MKIFFILFPPSIYFHLVLCDIRVGPDPWDYIVQHETVTNEDSDPNIPPDLISPPRLRTIESAGKPSIGEWFFKRIVAIILNGGQTKVNEDGEVDISIQMKLNPVQWKTLNEYIKSTEGFTEDMYRRSTGYIELAIYKPSVVQEITVAWSEYIQNILVEYKEVITWILGISAATGLLLWLWHHMSHKHVIIIVFVLLYVYEVITSYKEAEQQEIERFTSAINKCSWYFWKRTCEVPPPDPLIFMRHMNPLKIGIRMFTTLISEPMVALNASINTMIHGITDGLWFPFDKMLQGFLILSINILLIFLLVMITFNFLLNIPFNLSLGLGLINIGLKQRKRNFNLTKNNDSNISETQTSDRISAATLDRILEVCSRALENNNQQSRQIGNAVLTTDNQYPKLKRSASTGRLPSSSSLYTRKLCASETKFGQ